MRDYSKLLKLAKDNNGYVFTQEVTKNKIPKDYLKFAVEDGVLEKVATGIYISADAYVDDIFIYQKINTKVIYSAFTSAYLLELTTRSFEKFYGCTPIQYNKTRLCKNNVIIGEPADIYNLGLTKVKTSFGNTVVCHDIHRTVCDLFSPKYVGDKFVQVEALKTYLRRDDKNTIILMQYAKKLGVDKPLREKLEVLI